MERFQVGALRSSAVGRFRCHGRAVERYDRSLELLTSTKINNNNETTTPALLHSLDHGFVIWLYLGTAIFHATVAAFNITVVTIFAVYIKNIACNVSYISMNVAVLCSDTSRSRTRAKAKQDRYIFSVLLEMMKLPFVVLW